MDSVFPSLSPEKHYICEVNDKPHINMEHNILIPLLLTLGAGLATGIGSAIAFFARRTNKRLLSFSLGLSGGVMIYVSFVELFQQAHATLSDEWGAQTGIIVTVASFFAGILLIGIIDRLGGLALSVVKIGMLLAVLTGFFARMNDNYHWVKPETISDSVIYRPLQAMTDAVFPYLVKAKEKIFDETPSQEETKRAETEARPA